MLFIQQFQQLADILLAEGDGLAIVDYQAGNAHDIVLIAHGREVVQIIHFRGNGIVLRSDPLGSSRLLTMKSSESRMFMPRMRLTSLSTL